MVVIHILPFIIAYLSWHYSLGVVDLLALWRNFMWLVGHIFSIPLLLRTLFSPWKRMDEGYPKGFNLSMIGETLIVNILMRLVGFIVRVATIGVGVLTGIAVCAVGILALALWVTLPILVPSMILVGLIALISGNPVLFSI